MATQTLQLNVKSENNGKNYWNKCGVVFISTDDDGNITSVSVKHDMFPNVDMAAFPKKAKGDKDPVVE